VILQFEQRSEIGVVLNAGHIVVDNLNCRNPFYNQVALDEMLNVVPTSLGQKYQVCTNSLQTAFQIGISNAFASAGLYTSILCAVLMYFLLKCHERYRPDEIILSPEEQEISVRNATAEVLEALVHRAEVSLVSMLLL
jgi:hypothetical protein